MKITAVFVADFKRVREVEIEPGERTLVLIGGANSNGKSSILDAMTAALGGGRALPADPIRHGADRAEIRIELDDGGEAVVVTRVIKPDGKGSLEIRRDGAPVAKPQAWLDAIIGARFLDPLAFLALPSASQRATLLEMIDRDGRVAAMDRDREKHYTARTDIGRDLKRAQGALDSMPRARTAGPVEIDVADKVEQLAKLQAERGALAGIVDRLARAQNAELRADKNVERLRAELEAATEDHRAAATEMALAEAEASGAPSPAALDTDIAALRATISAAAETNRTAAALAAADARRVDADALVRRLDKDHAAQSMAIEEIDASKAAFLAAAALPVPGLGVSEDGVTYQDVPLAQASGAERLRVALALAMAASPNLRDVWCRDGSLMDDASLAMVAADAEAAGVRVWVERVSDRDEDAIVIEDGMVRS